jgi:hypothetical protein
MVVFADGTAIGDEREISRIFEGRRREHDALQQVEKLLADAIQQSGASWKVWLLLDRRLDEPETQPIRDNTAYRQLRQNVTLGKRVDRGDEKKAAFRLNVFLRDVRSKLVLAKQHMQRR